MSRNPSDAIERWGDWNVGKYSFECDSAAPLVTFLSHCVKRWRVNEALLALPDASVLAERHAAKAARMQAKAEQAAESVGLVDTFSCFFLAIAPRHTPKSMPSSAAEAEAGRGRGARRAIVAKRRR